MSQKTLHTVTITLKDQEDGTVAVHLEFAPFVREDTPKTPALHMAVGFLEWAAEQGEEV